MARTSGSKKVDYSKLVADYRSSGTSKKALDRNSTHQKMVEGTLGPEMIEWLKVNGVNEAGQPLRWSLAFEEALRLVADLRIAEVYTSKY